MIGTILLALLGLIVLLLLIACVRAAAIKSRTPLGQPITPDKETALQYARHLSAQLQCKTINAPDIPSEEIHEEFVKLQALLKEQYPLCFGAMQRINLGTDALLLRWPGADASRGAVVLMSHSDVVPATGTWQHPPFSGEIADGRIWGRGAVDIKSGLCAILEACEALLREGFTPACDVYVSSSNNEETMGDGAPLAVEYFKNNNIKIDLVSDEGGAILEKPMAGLDGYFAMLGIVEKGYANVKFTARSKGGHASAPPKNSPLVRLAKFMCHVEKHSPFKKEISTPVRQMFAALAPYMAFPYRLLLGNLWLFGPLLKVVLPALSPKAGAMLHTTCAFTMAQGSAAGNVIPENASVVANLRFIMHQNMEQSVAAIKAVADKYDLETEVLYGNDCSPYVDINAPRFQYVVDCVRKIYPEAGVAPYVMIGGTDARHFSPICDCVVRCAPLIMDQQQLDSMHGLDENIYVDALARGVDFYTLLVRNYQ